MLAVADSVADSVVVFIVIVQQQPVLRFYIADSVLILVSCCYLLLFAQ